MQGGQRQEEKQVRDQRLLVYFATLGWQRRVDHTAINCTSRRGVLCLDLMRLSNMKTVSKGFATAFVEI